MINEIVKNMFSLVKQMQEATLSDIEDVKAAKHEGLLDRNEKKELMIQQIADLKTSLNEAIVAAIQDGQDINEYRQKVDELETELRDLYALNSQLAAIVLPVQQMYKDMVDDIKSQNGGNLFDVKA